MLEHFECLVILYACTRFVDALYSRWIVEAPRRFCPKSGTDVFCGVETQLMNVPKLERVSFEVWETRLMPFPPFKFMGRGINSAAQSGVVFRTVWAGTATTPPGRSGGSGARRRIDNYGVAVSVSTHHFGFERSPLCKCIV